MSASLESQSTTAGAPFDDTRADVILRSSNGVDFCVFKIILSLASPIFADMFSIPSPSPASSETFRDKLPVVMLSEDSIVLDLALRRCYPIRCPELVELRDAHALLEFERKYQVDALNPPLTHYLMSAVERDPVSAYILATKYQYEDVAKIAARSCLKLPISKFRCDALRYVTGEEYQALIEYHSSCGAAASAVTLERKWLELPLNKLFLGPKPSSEGCASCMMGDMLQRQSSFPFSPITRAPRYLWSYLHRSALLLAHHPNVEAVTTEAFVLKDIYCPPCLAARRTDMLDFSRFFAREVWKAIEKVIGYSSKFGWQCLINRLLTRFL